MKNKFYAFMQGRYGTDNLNKALYISAVILIIISYLFRGLTAKYITFAAYLILIFSVFRMFSRNISKRYSENQKYSLFKNKLINNYKRIVTVAKMRKDYRIYTCPQCNKKVRIPKGKGKVRVVCPVCGKEFFKVS